MLLVDLVFLLGILELGLRDLFPLFSNLLLGIVFDLVDLLLELLFQFLLHFVHFVFNFIFVLLV